ncbi:MAG: hypothetical protein DHS20C19_15670 [Acidimicrobiales bacterium]|nr:MAG: hypothetical protein DHS20C19_15670 [Acidimicrobiales bacterium]
MAASLTINTKHSPLAIFLYVTKINLTIDGVAERVPWGSQTRPLEPGSHQVDISFQYFGRAVGTSSTTLELADGSETTLSYKAPMLMTSAGKVTVG